MSCGISESGLDCCVSNGSVKLECGHELPVVTMACNDKANYSKEGNMPVHDGYVGRMKAKALRDSGCSV